MPCISNQNIPRKKRGNDESIQQCTVGREGWRGKDEGEGKRACCLPLLLLFSLWGLCWVSILHLFLPNSCLLSPALLLPLSPAFFSTLTHSLSFPSCLSASPRGLIYGCGSPETAMSTHAFLCSLPYSLALRLTACTWCVFALYLCHAVLLLPWSKHVPLFLFVLFIVVKQVVPCYSCKHTQHIS